MNELNKKLSFSEWFESIWQRYYHDTNCPDPFKKKEILEKWLKTAWNHGYESAKY